VRDADRDDRAGQPRPREPLVRSLAFASGQARGWF